MYVYVYRCHSFRNLLISPTKSRGGVGYVDLEWILKDSEDKGELNIMTETILSTYEGHSIFTLFMDKFDVYE